MLAHRSTIPQINMVPHPITLNWHWANQPCSRPKINYEHYKQGSNRCKIFSLSFDPTWVRPADLPNSEQALYVPTRQPWLPTLSTKSQNRWDEELTFILPLYHFISFSDFTRMFITKNSEIIDFNLFNLIFF